MYEYGFITFGSQFNLNLQTGAFLQLILVLTGIASRLHMLCGEIGQAVDQAVDSLDRLSHILDVSISSQALQLLHLTCVRAA